MQIERCEWQWFLSPVHGPLARQGECPKPAQRQAGAATVDLRSPVVGRGEDNAVAAWPELDRIDTVGMDAKDRHHAVSLHAPDPDGSVACRPRDVATVRAEGDRPNEARDPEKAARLRLPRTPRLPVPDQHTTARARDDVAPVGTKRGRIWDTDVRQRSQLLRLTSPKRATRHAPDTGLSVGARCHEVVANTAEGDRENLLFRCGVYVAGNPTNP